ncbi:hypothetical protein MW887_005033 [Aspergillus wentii]|nr:hypothetical protein MW887_005033 [Aspergillus wentii]
MPNPADLPQELFHLVPDHALTAEEPDAQRLCSLSLLSRNWTLWKFLRTVRQNPHLAARVQTLKIGNWGFYPKAAVQGGDFRPAADEVELVRRAIHDAGIGHLEQRIIESLAKKDRRSLMALLLASLPNLVTVHAHVPMSDPVLGEVLRQTLEPRGRDEVHPLPGHEPQIPAGLEPGLLRTLREPQERKRPVTNRRTSYLEVEGFYSKLGYLFAVAKVFWPGLSG